MNLGSHSTRQEEKNKSRNYFIFLAILSSLVLVVNLRIYYVVKLSLSNKYPGSFERNNLMWSESKTLDYYQAQAQLTRQRISKYDYINSAVII